MDKTNEKKPRQFHASDIDWQELAAIGIGRGQLEDSGQMEALLCGEQTDVLPLRLTLLGAPIDMDASLQLVHGEDGPLLEITGVKPFSGE